MDEKNREAMNLLKAEAVKVLQPMAAAEMKKMQKVVEQSVKKIESYAQKNPEKVTLITAAVGAAVGAAFSIFLQSEARKKK